MHQTVSVAQFIDDCKKDLKGVGCIKPRYMAMFKNMIMEMDEVLDSDKTLAHKFKKSVKCLHSSSSAHVLNEVSYAENMEKLGSVALGREAETGIGSAFLKLSVINKDLANHRKTMCENLNNMVLFPLNSLLKGDMNKIGDMKKPVEEAWKEFKSKGMKKDPRKKTSEIVLYRIDPPEASDESEKERRLFMHTACEYLVKANEVKVKKGVELVQHLIEFYHAQYKYFNRGLELLESMKPYFDGLTGELQQLKTETDEEKKELNDIRNQLKTLYNLDSTKEGEKSKSYKIHGQQGDKVYGGERSGYLLKRSEGVHKKWQKRYCVIRDGLFTLAHNPQSAPTTTLNLLTCQVKPFQEKEKEKKFTFCLVAHNRTYIFQADDELDFDAWISVLSNAREDALNRAFGEGDDSLSKEPVSSIHELTQGIVNEVKRLPGNNQCVDCNTKEPTWLSTNLGVLVCIECSGIHRELGVHISRIRSLTLDRLVTAELLLARAVGNSDFNEIMEANLDPSMKPTSSSNMDERKEFIQQKYVQKKYINSSGNASNVLLDELRVAINHHDILAVLQLYGDGVDFSSPLPNDGHLNTALHYCVEQEDLTSLHIVDFMIQNCKNVDVLNSNGDTALHLAALSNNTECSKLLIRANANIDIVNKDGKTAQALAVDTKHMQVLELLQDAQDGRLGKFDNVKIDWGLEETDDIYSVPLDPSDLNIQLKDDMLVDATTRKNFKLPGIATPGSIQRSYTSPKGGMKTTAAPTPPAVTTAPSVQSRHSVAFPSSVQVLPQFTPDISSLSSTNRPSSPPPAPPGSGVKSGGAPPPPPPARKPTTKAKVPIPVPNLTPSVGKTTQKDPLPSPPAQPNIDSMVHLGSTAPSLSTFAPKQQHISGSKTLPNPNLSSPEKNFGPPPAPPTRSSSFIPRGVDPASVISSRPPDRQPPPAPTNKKGHARNQSEGNILYAQGLLQNQAEANARLRTNSVVDGQYSLQKDTIPIDPDAPPLPPPRPKANKDNNNLDTVNKQGSISRAVQRSSSMPKRVELKPKYRRAKALYDCEADHDDELSFIEGDIIIMKHESEADWWYGSLESNQDISGVFPLSFVHVLSE